MPLMPPTNVAAPTVGSDFAQLRRDVEELYRRTARTPERSEVPPCTISATKPDIPVGYFWLDTSEV